MRNRIVPVLIVLILILLVGSAGMAVHLIQKYTPTEDRMDAAQYYGELQDGEIPLIFGTELLEQRGFYQDGEAYLPIEVVQNYLNPRFYWDGNEQLLIYTTPAEKFLFSPDSPEYSDGTEVQGSKEYPVYTVRNEEPCINVKMVKEYSDIEYELLEGPNRIVVQYQWEDVMLVEVKEEAPVRYQGGIKSEILTNVKKGEELRLIEEMDNWDCVATADGFIGYIEKKHLAGDAYQGVFDRDFEAPVYSSISRDYKINLAWHQVTSEAANETLGQTMKKVSGVNVISPTWFSIKDNDGEITNYATEYYVTQAHEMGLEVWGLVDNFSEDINTFEVLSHTTSRTNLVENIVSQALRFSLDGINIDFEALAEETGPHFIQFLREISILCRKNDLVLSVDNPVPENYTPHYDRASQAEVADYIIIMGYDEHFQGSEEAGSVASLPWVEEGILDTLEEVPAEKVINAIPFYTRIWKTSAGIVTSEAVGMKAAREYVKRHNIETYWLEDVKQMYGEYEEGNDLYQIWMETDESIEAKMELIQKYQLAGVAEWKLGFERPSVWKVISSGLKE